MNGILFWLIWLAVGLSLAAILLLIPLLRAWRRLHSHAYVQPLDIAMPDIADALKQMIASIAAAADIEPPPTFICRSHLPNAFVVAGFLRHELYLSDELLEDCDIHENALDRLRHTIAHEISHIKHNDGLRLGILTYASQWTERLQCPKLQHSIEKRMNHIEQQADELATRLLTRMTIEHLE